jgi:hypothetical protein
MFFRKKNAPAGMVSCALRSTFPITIGPAIGGLLAGASYLLLFISDAVISLLAVVLVATLLPETKPQRHADAPQETVAKTFAGYGKVFRDLAFMLFLGFVLLQVLAYMNMNTTLGVYLARPIWHAPHQIRIAP